MTSQVSPSPVAPTTPMEDKAEDGPNGPDPNRWFFEKERLETTPSRKCGIDADKELTYRQQSANFIQDMGQRLQVNQLCINTAIVYMHRFYMYHSFSHFHRNHVSTASIFLAAKVEEQPRKLEHVIKVAHYCLNRDSPPIDTKSENYAEQTSELVMTENILLQTLGFDINIDHPHTHVVKCCQLVRASKDLAQTSYFMATNSLHLTTMCLQYKPTVVACVCIHLTCKWSNWEIPRSKEGRDWFWYVDDTVTIDQLEKLTTEFLAIFDKSPSRLKKKILSLNQASGGSNYALNAFPTLNMDPTNSPGAPHSNRSHSPATPQAGSNSTLGKRSGPAIKPSGSQVNNKQPKVNGGIGHHSIKPPHGSQVIPSNSSSKHPHYSGSKGVGPPGSHHGAKDAHNLQQHGKPLGHHHSSHPTQAYPHGSSNRPSSSHSHSSGHHSQGHAPPTGQPPKPPSSSHAMSGQQHPSKPLHPQPSKVPYNYNTKSQPPAGGQPPPKPTSSSSALQSASNPPVNKSHQPPPFSQVKKPYPENTTRRENPPDFNGRRENPDEMNRRSNVNSQHSRTRPPDSKPAELYSSGPSVTSNLPAVSLPFNAATTSETSRIWGDTGNSVTETRNPASRPSSLFSPDPELIESSIFLSSSIQSLVKTSGELSPIGDVTIGAKGGDANSDNPLSMPPAVSCSTLFPNLFEFGMGGRSSSNEGYFGDMKPESSVGPSDDIKPEPTTSLSTIPVTTSSLTTVSAPMNLIATKPEVTSPSSRVTDLGEGEPSHKKLKKSKKEKHKHKDKEKDRHEEKKEKKDKEEKKHKDKNRDKSRDDKKHKEKHKKEKHKEKERDRSKAKDSTDAPGLPDPAGTGSRIKINLGSRMLQDGPPEKQKSKHSSKKHSTKSNPAAVESSNTPSIKLKIAPIRPPTNDDKLAYTSKPN